MECRQAATAAWTPGQAMCTRRGGRWGSAGPGVDGWRPATRKRAGHRGGSATGLAWRGRGPGVAPCGAGDAAWPADGHDQPPGGGAGQPAGSRRPGGSEAAQRLLVAAPSVHRRAMRPLPWSHVVACAARGERVGSSTPPSAARKIKGTRSAPRGCPLQTGARSARPWCQTPGWCPPTPPAPGAGK